MLNSGPVVGTNGIIEELELLRKKVAASQPAAIVEGPACGTATASSAAAELTAASETAEDGKRTKLVGKTAAARWSRRISNADPMAASTAVPVEGPSNLLETRAAAETKAAAIAVHRPTRRATAAKALSMPTSPPDEPQANPGAPLAAGAAPPAAQAPTDKQPSPQLPPPLPRAQLDAPRAAKAPTDPPQSPPKKSPQESPAAQQAVSPPKRSSKAIAAPKSPQAKKKRASEPSTAAPSTGASSESKSSFGTSMKNEPISPAASAASKATDLDPSHDNSRAEQEELSADAKRSRWHYCYPKMPVCIQKCWTKLCDLPGYRSPAGYTSRLAKIGHSGHRLLPRFSLVACHVKSWQCGCLRGSVQQNLKHL